MAYENQDKCSGCGISIPHLPEDADASERLCDTCLAAEDKSPSSSGKHKEAL
jgi:hypothetical protein